MELTQTCWRHVLRPLAILVGVVAAAPAARGLGAEPYDLVITGGRVIDGTGAPWFYADVAIRDGRIAAIGKLGEFTAARSIAAGGCYVAPGFIDMMGQTASPFLDDPQAGLNLLTQGITTINAGEGHSAAPLDEPAARRAGWKTMREYFATLEARGLPLHVAQTVGHTQVRRIVLGDTARRPDERELSAMQELVREAMEAGAVGVSTALIYPPAVYASTDEIAALALVAGKYGGGYFTHMRNEGDRLLEAIDEALAIGSQAGVPVHIFHLKTAGQHNWPKMELALARIKAARAAGQQVTADIYPYINNGLGITAFLHPRHSEEGVEALRRKLADPQTRRQMRLEMESETGWENWFHHVGQDWNRVIVAGMRAAPYHEHQGTPLGQIARRVNQDPWEVFFELCRSGAFAMPQSMSEANKCRAMCEPFVSFCTDVGPLVSGRSADHPRGWGSFPRALARYVRELGVIPLEQAVSQMTSLAANQLFQHDRGRLAPGLPADVVVFQLEELQDRATFSEPNLPADGVRCVIVNGKVVLEGGKLTGARPGRVLRGPGYVPQ